MFFVDVRHISRYFQLSPIFFYSAFGDNNYHKEVTQGVTI